MADSMHLETAGLANLGRAGLTQVCISRSVCVGIGSLEQLSIAGPES